MPLISSKIIFLSLMAWCILTGLSHPAWNLLWASEYYTLPAYEQLRPEQEAKAKAFSRMVSLKGVPISKTDQKKYNRSVSIAVIYPGMQVSDYWRRSIAAFKARMDEIQLNYEIREFFTKPAVDYRIQEQMIRESLDMNPDYLIFTLDIQRHKRMIQRIITHKSPKVILQNITTPLRAWEGKQPFLYVGFDHILGTRKIARYFLEKTDGKGSYALLYFSQGYVSVMRGDSFSDSLKNYPNLRQVAAYYTDGNRERARLSTLDILNTSPDINFIYACATDVALGAIDALKQTPGTDHIMVNGWGGGSSELSAIMAGDMDVTVMRINDDNGVAMAEAIRLDIEGRIHEVPQVFSGEFALVEKGIQPKRLFELKQSAFRYSGMNP